MFTIRLRFGSGLDMRYFKSLGYEVEGIDPTISFVNNLKDEFDVYHKRVEDITIINRYEGIWACASLLHVKREDLLDVFRICFIALKPDGVMYASFKYGDKEVVINDRYFNYVNEDILDSILINTEFKLIDKCITHDVRKGREGELWINVLLTKNK